MTTAPTRAQLIDFLLKHKRSTKTNPVHPESGDCLYKERDESGNFTGRRCFAGEFLSWYDIPAPSEGTGVHNNLYSVLGSSTTELLGMAQALADGQSWSFNTGDSVPESLNSDGTKRPHEWGKVVHILWENDLI